MLLRRHVPGQELEEGQGDWRPSSAVWAVTQAFLNNRQLCLPVGDLPAGLPCEGRAYLVHPTPSLWWNYLRQNSSGHDSHGGREDYTGEPQNSCPWRLPPTLPLPARLPQGCYLGHNMPSFPPFLTANKNSSFFLRHGTEPKTYYRAKRRTYNLTRARMPYGDDMGGCPRNGYRRFGKKKENWNGDAQTPAAPHGTSGWNTTAAMAMTVGRAAQRRFFRDARQPNTTHCKRLPTAYHLPPCRCFTGTT